MALLTGASSGIEGGGHSRARRSGFEVIDAASVARVIVAAATDPKPKLRSTVGPTAGRPSALRRFVAPRAFDRQIRKLNRLAADARPPKRTEGLKHTARHNSSAVVRPDHGQTHQRNGAIR